MFGGASLLTAMLAMAPALGSSPALPPGTFVVLDEANQPVASVTIRTGRPVTISLPEGNYRLVPQRGAAPVSSFEVTDARPVVLATREPATAVPPAASGVSAPAGPAAGRAEPPPAPVARWKRWGAPVLSTFLPGVGQMITAKTGRGIALLATTAGLAAGVAAVVLTRNPSEGATPDDGGDPAALEIAHLIGISSLTTGLVMVWAGQVMDAHALGRGRPAEPERDYAVAVRAERYSTIGLRAGQPSYALYDDFSVSVMGQVVPRVEIGIADISMRLGDRRDAYVLQAGPRATWRFFDRERLWLHLGGGFIFQGAGAPASGRPLGQDEDYGASDRALGAIGYLQAGAEWFLLDRWTLGLTPRVSLPLTDRHYAKGRQIPRYSTTFEFGASVGVRF